MKDYTKISYTRTDWMEGKRNYVRLDFQDGMVLHISTDGPAWVLDSAIPIELKRGPR